MEREKIDVGAVIVAMRSLAESGDIPGMPSKRVAQASDALELLAAECRESRATLRPGQSHDQHKKYVRAVQNTDARLSLGE